MPQVWMLFREYDNGQVFLMADHLTRREAWLLLGKHSARGHNPVYFVKAYGSPEERQDILMWLMPDRYINGLGLP